MYHKSQPSALAQSDSQSFKIEAEFFFCLENALTHIHNILEQDILGLLE